MLVPTGGPTPDRLPARTLRDAVRAGLPAGSATRLVEVPFAFRDPASDRALADAVGLAFGAARTEVLGSDDARWRDVLGRLDRGEPLPTTLVPADVATHLERWRPPPSRRGLVVMFTGLSGSGKSTLAAALADHVRDAPRAPSACWTATRSAGCCRPTWGSTRRRARRTCAGSASSRAWSPSTAGSRSARPIAPYAATRQDVRHRVEQVGDFVLVHVATPLAVCEARDVKGLYARARAGLVPQFTGISDPYEEPDDADVVVDTSQLTERAALDVVLAHLRAGGWLQAQPAEVIMPAPTVGLVASSIRMNPPVVRLRRVLVGEQRLGGAQPHPADVVERPARPRPRRGAAC